MTKQYEVKKERWIVDSGENEQVMRSRRKRGRERERGEKKKN